MGLKTKKEKAKIINKTSNQMKKQTKKEYLREYQRRPEVIIKRLDYYDRHEIKLRQKLYYQEYYKQKKKLKFKKIVT